MKQFFITVFGVIVGMIVFSVLMLFVLPLVLIGVVASATSGTEKAPSSMVLTIDLREPVADQPARTAFPGLEPNSTLRVVRHLAAAKTDDRVKGVYLRGAEFGAPMAFAEELRASLQDFRSSGKFVIAHTQGLEASSLSGYVALADADELWMQQAGTFAIAGYSFEPFFARGVLDNLKITPDYIQYEAYKGAADTFTQTGFTPEFRESFGQLAQGLYDASMAMIAADRARSVEELTTLFAAGPYNAGQALENRLIDKIGFPEDAAQAALSRAGAGAEFVELADYEPTASASGPEIAVIGGEGPVETGGGDSDLFSAPAGFASDTLAKAFKDATEDADVKAIVFRVNTPGGSVSASEQIWDAVRRAKEAGKPVIVSMGPQATSGGYYVSANADAVVALDTTITGSIGVVFGKFVTKGATDWLGLNFEELTYGPEHANAFTGQRAFSNYERTRLDGLIKEAYFDFTQKVADGRNLPVDQVRASLAGGRLWTGAQARERGLATHAGGFMAAIAVAKEKAGIAAEEAVTLKFLPLPEDPFTAFTKALGASAQAPQTLGALMRAAKAARLDEAAAAVEQARQPGAQSWTPAFAPR